jgi:regulator of cell morphogenesis and NO signaling
MSTAPGIIQPKNSVRNIVVAFPETRRVFEENGIDYCCGGGKILEQAARELGIPVLPLIEQLQQTVNPGEHADEDKRSEIDRRLAAADLPEIVDHILATHHEYLKKTLPLIDSLLGKVVAAHGERHGEAVLLPLRLTYQGLRDELTAHLMKEEEVLFPMLLGMEQARSAGAGRFENHCGSVQNPIQQMEFEHVNAGSALVEMRRITGDYLLPEGACPTFAGLYDELRALEADLHQHIHLENNLLFPRAVKMEAELGQR